MSDTSDSPAPESSANANDHAADAVPREGRLLGIDFGTKRIGIAVSTPEQNIASPLETYTRRDRQTDAEHISRVAQEYGVVGLVIGLPVHMSGDESGKSREARIFGTWLGKATALPVTWWDERFTSQMADQSLSMTGLSRGKRKRQRDAVAACLILQAFLDAKDQNQPDGWQGFTPRPPHIGS